MAGTAWRPRACDADILPTLQMEECREPAWGLLAHIHGCGHAGGLRAIERGVREDEQATHSLWLARDDGVDAMMMRRHFDISSSCSEAQRREMHTTRWWQIAIPAVIYIYALYLLIETARRFW